MILTKQEKLQPRIERYEKQKKMTDFIPRVLTRLENQIRPEYPTNLDLFDALEISKKASHMLDAMTPAQRQHCYQQSLKDTPKDEVRWMRYQTFYTSECFQKLNGDNNDK